MLFQAVELRPGSRTLLFFFQKLWLQIFTTSRTGKRSLSVLSSLSYWLKWLRYNSVLGDIITGVPFVSHRYYIKKYACKIKIEVILNIVSFTTTCMCMFQIHSYNNTLIIYCTLETVLVRYYTLPWNIIIKILYKSHCSCIIVWKITQPAGIHSTCWNIHG